MAVVVEHLVVLYKDETTFTKGRFKSKYHDDLGSDLQKALEQLEQEGWEVVTMYGNGTNIPITLILKRVPR